MTTFLNTPEELRDAGIIDAAQADKLIAQRDYPVLCPVWCSRCRATTGRFDGFILGYNVYPWLCHACRKPTREGGVA